MIMRKESKKFDIKISEGKLEQVDLFKHLGALLNREASKHGSRSEWVISRLYHSLTRTFKIGNYICKQTKILVFRPILPYGSANWVVTNSLKSRIHATDTKYLRGY